jgi:hypothetical protein
VQQLKKHGIGNLTSIHMKIIMIFISSYTTWWPIGVWSVEEVILASIETNASVGGCREGKAKWKQVGNSSALVAQSTLMIKKRTL